MESVIQEFLSEKHGKHFASKLPQLKKKIGVLKFDHVGSSYGVGGNTFRALTLLDEPPSEVYRKWAHDICNQLNVLPLEKQLETQIGFDLWHSELANSLQIYWQSRQQRKLSFAHQHKLIDLFIKWLSAHDLGSQKFSENLVIHANCALDSQSLDTLNECISMMLPIMSPSMGHIHNRATYDFCQILINKFAREYGGTRLLFDYFAWKDTKQSSRSMEI